MTIRRKVIPLQGAIGSKKEASKRSPISIREAQSSCREEGNEKTPVTNSSVRVDRGDSGAGMPVRRGGAGPATDLLGMADREQPFHERAVRSVHAGSRVRARQHQAGEQHSERRSAGERRRNQVRQ